jgi:hypothetical protein
MRFLKRISLRTPQPPPWRVQETSQRISLRTPRPTHQRESTPHILSSHSEHDTKVTTGHNLTYECTPHTRPHTLPLHTHTHFLTYDPRTHIPSSHRRTYITTFSIQRRSKMFMLTKERCHILFFAFSRESDREETGGYVCKQTGWMDVYIPSSHRRRIPENTTFQTRFS